jgi:hypothetical protein
MIKKSDNYLDNYRRLLPSAVGTPVTRRPPHRPRRAVFPHRVPQLYSPPRCKAKALGKHPPLPDIRETGHAMRLSTFALLAIPRREVGLCLSDPTCPAQVSFAGYILLSSPSPCTWLSHARSTTLDKTPPEHPADFPFHSTPPPPRTAFQSDA